MRYDPEEVMEQLANVHGCAAGSCGYDYDSECYWWLQSKVNEEIERQEQESGALPQVLKDLINAKSALLGLPSSYFGGYEPTKVRVDGNDWTAICIDVEIPCDSSDPFSDGIGTKTHTIPLKDKPVKFHGGGLDGQEIYCGGPICATRLMRVAKKIAVFEPWNIMDGVVNQRYRLFLIDNVPHYYFESEV